MIKFEDFKNTNTTEINEVKLSRVITKFTSEDRITAMISAYRCDESEDNNENNTREVSKEAKSKGFGFVYVKGSWYEEEHQKTCQEVSFLFEVKKENEEELFKFLTDISNKYNQDAFIFKGVSYPFGVYNKIGKIVSNLTNIKIDQKTNFDSIYSELKSGSNKGRNFVFEDACRIPSAETMTYALILKKFLQIPLEECKKQEHKPRRHHHAHW